MTFDPVAYDSTPEPSVALLAQHQLQPAAAGDLFGSFTTTLSESLVLQPLFRSSQLNSSLNAAV